MKKKILGVGLALAMALSMSAFAADAKTYAVKDQYTGDKAQGPDWTYMYDDGAGWKEMAHCSEVGHADYGDNWRIPGGDEAENYTSFNGWNDEVLMDMIGGKTKVALVWTAPADGKADIAAWEFGPCNADWENGEFVKLNGSFKPYKVSILHNDKELCSVESKDMDAKTEAQSVEVKKGDKIYFVADQNGNNANGLVKATTASITLTPAGGDANTTEGTQKNPSTGEAAAALPVMAGVVALAAVVLAKKAKKA